MYGGTLLVWHVSPPVQLEESAPQTMRSGVHLLEGEQARLVITDSLRVAQQT